VGRVVKPGSKIPSGGSDGPPEEAEQGTVLEVGSELLLRPARHQASPPLPEKDEAWRLWHEMMARPPEVRKVMPSGQIALVVEVLDAFLEWTQTNQAEIV
jgi:hypothetical protein